MVHRIYRYDCTSEEELVFESRNYKDAYEAAMIISKSESGYTYRLQVERKNTPSYPFRYFEQGLDVTEKFRHALLSAVYQ